MSHVEMEGPLSLGVVSFEPSLIVSFPQSEKYPTSEPCQKETEMERDRNGKTTVEAIRALGMSSWKINQKITIILQFCLIQKKEAQAKPCPILNKNAHTYSCIK